MIKIKRTWILHPLIPLAFAAALRTYPYILRSTPYMTDSWPIIHLAEEISRNTPTPFRGGPPFDEYNVYWPFVAIFTVETAQLTGLNLLKAAAITVPLTAALSTLIFYILTLKLTGRREAAFASAMLFAACGFHVLLTAGVKKETYANPLYMSTLYLYIFSDRGKIPIYLLCFTALVATHHLTTAVITIALINISIASTIISIKKGRETDMVKWALTATSLFIATAYYFSYAYKGFKYVFKFTDAISIFSFQVIAWLPVLHIILTHRKQRSKGTRLTPFLVAASTLSILALTSLKHVTPGAPILPLKEQVTMIPYEIIVLAAAYGYIHLKRKVEKEKFIACLVWLTSILGLEGYALFSSPYSLTVTYRLLNFLYPPITVFRWFRNCNPYSKKKNTSSRNLPITHSSFIHGYSLSILCRNS